MYKVTNQKRRKLVALLLLSALLFGCTSAPVKEKKEMTAAEQLVHAAEPLQSEAEYTMEQNDKLFLALLRFTDRTASKVLSGGSENRLYSPMSFYVALAALSEGAAGETKADLQEFLGWKGEDLSDVMKAIIVQNTRNTEGSQIGIYNSVWVDEKLKEGLQKDYMNRLSTDYFSDLFIGDLNDAKVLEQMESWMSEKTNGFLAPKLNNTEGDRLFTLINALYYKSAWKEEFKPEMNEQKLFLNADGSEKLREFMVGNYSSVPVRTTGQYTAVELEQKGGSVHFILPAEGSDIQGLLENEKFLEDYFASAPQLSNLVLRLPKYEIISNIPGLLEDTGLASVIGADQAADFTGMLNPMPEGFGLSAIIQDCRIVVDEKGVEAAAITEIEKTEEKPASSEAILELNLDRPFLFLLTLPSGELAFIGVVNHLD